MYGRSSAANGRRCADHTQGSSIRHSEISDAFPARPTPGARRGFASADPPASAPGLRRSVHFLLVASKVWTAAELEQMTPAERRAIFDASIVTDLDQVPAEFLARVRARAERIIAESESTDRA